MNQILKISYILLVLAFSSGYFVLGQQPYFREVINTSYLEGAQINCIHQDNKGFIWIGTNNGPYQFDGVSYTKVHAADKIGSTKVTCIFDDVDGKIWFGYENGDISTYNYIQESLLISEGPGPQSKITTIIQTADSAMVFGTYGDGLFVFKNNSFYHINTTSGLSDDFIYTMILDHQQNIWVGTDNGISIVELKNNNHSIRTITIEDGLPDFIIQDLAIDTNGLVWIGTHDSGVCFYDPAQKSFTMPPGLEKWQYGPVNDILLIYDRIWIATNSWGVIDYSISTEKVKNYQQCENIDLSRINQLLYDKEGNIWLSSHKKICQSFGSSLEFLTQFNGIKTDNIHALTVDSKNRVLFANEIGIFRFDPDGSDPTKLLKQLFITYEIGKQKIMSLYEDPFGFIWIGTFGNGIIRLNPNNGQQVLLSEKEGLVNGNVLSIKGTKSEIWFATLGGASKIDINNRLADIQYIPKFENYQEKEGLSNNFIYHLYIDPQNRVWFATDGSGLFFYEKGQIYPLSNENFNNKIVYSIAGDKQGNIWINLANEGIYKYDGESAQRVLNDPDHKNLSFTGLYVNNQNDLVMAYNEGIDIMDIQTGDIVHYEGNAGLSGCNPDLNTIDLDAQGNTWIGTTIGLVKYAGSSRSVNKKPASIINIVAVYLEQIDPQKQSTFPYFDNHFSFDYSGLWFQYPDKVDFLVQLEGHDLGWIKTKNQSVIYSDLKPGEYTFKVKSALYNNFKNASTASYSFTIKNPYWATIWFYVILIFAIGLILYSYIRFRENRIRQKQAALQEKIKFQFENLKSQINPHFLFNSFSTLIALIETKDEEAVEYVQELSGLFRNILEFKDQDVISIQEEMDIIANYYKLQKRRYGNNLELKINDEVLQGTINIPPMTIQMLIENAIKHNIVSKDKPLNIEIFSNDERSFIYIKNNLQLKQEHIDSTGIGIQNIINRYKLLTEKEIEITQTNDIFMVGLPVIN